MDVISFVLYGSEMRWVGLAFVGCEIPCFDEIEDNWDWIDDRRPFFLSYCFCFFSKE